MLNKKPIPTEPYPRLLWYQEKRIPCTDEEREKLHNIYVDSAIILLEKTHKSSSLERKLGMAKEIATTKVDLECSKPTTLKKMVVNTHAEHIEAKEMIESSDIFKKWYKMGEADARTR